MGRRAQPSSVKAQKAAVRSQRKPAEATGEAVDIVSDGGEKAPKWLVGEGLEIWNRLGPVLRGQRLVQAPDELAFARYCRNFAQWKKLRDQLDTDGYTYDASTVNGGTLRRADPSFLIADRLERQLLAAEDRFGMNPAARQSITIKRAAAAGGGQGTLSLDTPRPGDPAAQAAAAAAAEAITDPVGMLN